jgi:hypothetical protein
MKTLLTLTKLARSCDTTADRVQRKVRAGLLNPTAKLYTGAPLFDLNKVEEYRAVLARVEGR